MYSACASSCVSKSAQSNRSPDWASTAGIVSHAAEHSNVEILVESLRQHEAVPVAVGSGTLNDSVKRAAHECERPYLCVGTAHSMDGYTSFGASIAKDGRKQTLECPAPRAVLGNVDVLVNASGRMTASGYADLLCKATASADWMVALALKIEELHPKAWSLVHEHLREWTAKPAELRAGDGGATDVLMEGLTMAGLAMQVAAPSRPASGAEHQFSHLWEMEGLGHDDDPPLSHGFKVGVGSIAITALYERVLPRDLGDLDVDGIVDGWPARRRLNKRHGRRTCFPAWPDTPSRRAAPSTSAPKGSGNG